MGEGEHQMVKMKISLNDGSEFHSGSFDYPPRKLKHSINSM
jgi:hypothetical protein